MGTNQAFVSYETDLRARRAEVAELNKKLEEASNLAQSEKERADKADKKAKKYRGRLNTKGKELEDLTEELKTARQSREKIESELKEKLFDKVHERCKLVKDLLVDLKSGPGDVAHLYGQTKNNLVLVRDLLSDKPPNLKDEKATLKKELREYKGAPQRYDRAFNNILRILSFQNGDFPDANAEEEELVLSEDDISSGDEDATKELTRVQASGGGGEDDKANEADEETKEPEVKDQIAEDPEVGNQIVRDSEDQLGDETILDQSLDAGKPSGLEVADPEA